MAPVWACETYIVHHHNGTELPCGPQAPLCTTTEYCAPWCRKETLFPPQKKYFLNFGG